MTFKQWINEVAEPVKPSGRLTKKKFWKKPGTAAAALTHEYTFKTKLGNLVQVHLEEKGEGWFRVLFYVNGTLVSERAERDPEILSGVLHVVKEKANKLGAKRISFEAWHDDGDVRVKRNLDVAPFQKRALDQLDHFEKIIERFPVRMIPPSQSRIDLFKKFNMGEAKPLPDLDTTQILQDMKKLRGDIGSSTMNNGIYEFLDKIFRIDWLKFGLNIPAQNFILALKNLEGAWMSNTDRGWRIDKNRRQLVYSKLMKRYLGDEYVIEGSPGSTGSFQFVRKV